MLCIESLPYFVFVVAAVKEDLRLLMDLNKFAEPPLLCCAIDVIRPNRLVLMSSVKQIQTLFPSFLSQITSCFVLRIASITKAGPMLYLCQPLSCPCAPRGLNVARRVTPLCISTQSTSQTENYTLCRILQKKMKPQQLVAKPHFSREGPTTVFSGKPDKRHFWSFQ